MKRGPAACRISHPRAGEAILLREIPSGRDPLGRRMRGWIGGIEACEAALLIVDDADRPIACIGIAPWLEHGPTDRAEVHAAAIGGAGTRHAALRRISAWLTIAPALVGAAGAVVDLPAARTELVAMCHRIGFRCFRVVRRAGEPWILASMPVAADAEGISTGPRVRFDRRAWLARLTSGTLRDRRSRDPGPVPGLTVRAAGLLDRDRAARAWLRLGPTHDLASGRVRSAILRTVRFWSAPGIGEPWVVAERRISGGRQCLILADSARVLRSAAALESLRILCAARSVNWVETCLSPVPDPGLPAVLGLSVLGTNADRSFTFVEDSSRGPTSVRSPPRSPPRKLPA